MTSRAPIRLVSTWDGVPGVQLTASRFRSALGPQAEISLWLPPEGAEDGPGPPPAVHPDLAEAEVLVVRRLPAWLLASAGKVRWVHGVWAGTEHLPLAEFERRGIRVTSSSGAGARSIAEFAVARLLAVWKQHRALDVAQRAARWEPVYTEPVAGRRVLVLGVGAIGSHIGQLLHAFGVHVVGVRRNVEAGPPPGFSEVIPADQILAHVGSADAIVSALPLTPQTRGTISAAVIRAMRDDAVVCNISRGPVVDESALISALQENRLGAAILDVFDEEPLPAGSPLWQLPNAHLSAHCSVSLREYCDGVLTVLAEEFQRYADGTPSLRGTTTAS